MHILQHPISLDTLEGYILGHLSPHEEAELEEHLLVCEQCRQALTETEGDVLFLKTALRELMSEG